MNEEFFKNVIDKYDSIKSPEELYEIAENSIRRGKKWSRYNEIRNLSYAMVVIFIVFTILVNTSTSFVQGIKDIPIIGPLAKLVAYDSGAKNAFNKGNVQEVNKIFEDNGVKLTITSLIGDSKRLWIGYKLEGEEKLALDKITFKDEKTKEDVVGLSMGLNYGSNDEDQYIEVSFNNVSMFPRDILMKVEVRRYNKENEQALAAFNVPISIDEKILTNNSVLVPVDEKYSSAVGDLHFKELEVSLTNIKLAYGFNSDKFIFMGFHEAYLEDEKGNKCTTQSFYGTVNSEGNKNLEFRGGILSNSKNITLKTKGIYYLPRKDKYITVDLKNKQVEPNSLGIKLGEIQEDGFELIGEGIKGLGFTTAGRGEKGNEIEVIYGGSSFHSDDNKYRASTRIKIKGYSSGKIKLEIDWILRDKTEPFEIRLK